MRNRVLIVVLAAVALGGCGGDATLSAGSAQKLEAQVAAVRQAASEGDRAGALEALDGMADQVRDLQAGGSLATADAEALRRGIARAKRRARAEIAEPEPAATAEPTATATATATATPEPPPAKPAKPGNGKGKGKAKAKTSRRTRRFRVGEQSYAVRAGKKAKVRVRISSVGRREIKRSGTARLKVLLRRTKRARKSTRIGTLKVHASRRTKRRPARSAS